MAADCFWCKSGATGSVPSYVGKIGEAIGCCVKCQVFCCGHHAVRNTARQEFKCYKCLVLKLVSSAVDDPKLNQKDKEELKNLDPGLVHVTSQPNESKFDNYREFELSSPELKNWFESIKETEIDWSEWPTAAGEALQKLPPDKLLFLKTAGYLLSEIEGTGDRFLEGMPQPMPETSPLQTALLHSLKVKSYSQW